MGTITREPRALMEHQAIRDQLSEYLDSTLGQDERKWLERHLPELLLLRPRASAGVRRHAGIDGARPVSSHGRRCPPQPERRCGSC